MLYEYRYIIDVGMEHGMKTLYLVLQFKNLHMRWITLQSSQKMSRSHWLKKISQRSYLSFAGRRYITDIEELSAWVWKSDQERPIAPSKVVASEFRLFLRTESRFLFLQSSQIQTYLVELLHRMIDSATNGCSFVGWLYPGKTKFDC